MSATPCFLHEKIASAEISELESHFFENIKAQGGSIASFKNKISEVRSLHMHQVVAEENGFFTVSLDQIRKTLVSLQARVEADGNPFSDPAGVILLKRPGEWVRKGQVLATVRVAGQGMQSIIKDFKLGICRTSSMPYGVSGEGVALDE